MGDPVLAGGALDRVHRPRPAWGPFFMVAALLLAGALLRFFWSVPVSAQGVYLWREGAYQSLGRRLGGNCCACGGIFLYGCVPVGTLDKGALYRAGGRFGLWFSGRIYPDERAASLDCLGCILRRHSFQHDFYSHLRGRGVPAARPRLGGAAGQRFCHCAGALAVYHGAASGRGVCAGACGACRVSGMLRRRLVWAWRKEKLCGCAGRDSGLSCGDIFAGAAVDAGSGREPSAASGGAACTGCKCSGRGLLDERPAAHVGRDAVAWPRRRQFAARGKSGARHRGRICREGGAGAARRLPAGFRGLAVRYCLRHSAGRSCRGRWPRTAMRTRSSIGRLCAVGCCALLTMHGVLNLLSCLGWSSARGMLPFLDGGWTGVMQAGLAGLLLSAFRLDDVLREPQGTCAPKAPARLVPSGRFAYSDGTLHIRLR